MRPVVVIVIVTAPLTPPDLINYEKHFTLLFIKTMTGDFRGIQKLLKSRLLD